MTVGTRLQTAALMAALGGLGVWFAVGCGKTPTSPDPMTSAPTTPDTAATGAPGSSVSSPTVASGAPHSAAGVDVPGLAKREAEIRAGIPQGSGDYARALALATLHQEGKLSYPDLERAIVARRLPPHKLGDGYLMIPVPKPPPPTEFDPKMMPADWEGTWGEVAMAYWLGALDKPLYLKLHRAAHPDCKQD